MRQQYNKSGLALLAVLAVLGSSASAMAQTTYTVTDLGTLPGLDGCYPNGLNELGDVVGLCGGSTGFIWRDGVMVSTGRLAGGTYSNANVINMRGTVAGEGDTGNGRPQAWVTSPTGLINIFPNNGGNTRVVGINNAGAICGFYTKSLSGRTNSWHGAIWTVDRKDPRKYRTTDLPSLPGIDSTFTSAIPWAFNQLGQAAGWAVNDVIGQHASFWNNDPAHTIVDLGTFPGDWSSIAWGMNDLGQVVGESHPPSHNRPVLWDNDPAHTAYELPVLAGDTDGVAVAINNFGQAIGTSSNGDSSHVVTRQVLWQGGSATEMQLLLDAASADWTIQGLTAINNAGQITALGLRNGRSAALLLTPVLQ